MKLLYTPLLTVAMLSSVFFCTLAPTVVLAQPTTPPATVTPTPPQTIPVVTPQLSVPIPGLTFQTATISGGRLTSNQLGQYIAAMYRYAVAIVLMTAIIMTVYGGFRYLIGASLGDIKAGKQIIQDAIVGMILVLGAYLILQTVNPDTIMFRPLVLTTVDAEDLNMTTRNDTGGGEFTAAASGDQTNCPLSNLAPSHADTPFPCGHAGQPTCTDRALEANRDPRATAFVTGIGATIRSTDPHQRILDVGNAAVACRVHLGSCGNTVYKLWTAAGIQSSGTGPYHNSALTRLAIRTHTCPTGTTSPPPDGCSPNRAAWQAAVRAAARPEQDRVAALLRPGDKLIVFVGNSEPSGDHSVLFMGWDGNHAKVVQGQHGKLVWPGRICLKTACGDNFLPIMRIQRGVGM